MIHDLKTWPSFFADLSDGRKNFEIRDSSDRRFAVGDTLLLREWEPKTAEYTGREVCRVVTYVTGFQQRGLFVVMGLRPSLPETVSHKDKS